MPKKPASAKKTGLLGAAKKARVRKKAVVPPPTVAVPAATPLAGPAILDRLHAVIMDRRTADPARSHSARLLSRGAAKVAQKFGEEAVECLIEATLGNQAALVAESADVLYHLVVMWVSAGVDPGEVWAELVRREGVSGVVEKASRLKPLLGTSKIP